MKKRSFYAVLMVTIGLFMATNAMSDNVPTVTSGDQNGTVNLHDPTLELTSVSDIETVYIPE